MRGLDAKSASARLPRQPIPSLPPPASWLHPPQRSAGSALLGPLWLAAIAWTVLASLAGALGRGLRRGDWSAFGRFRFQDDDGEADEFASRTGRYQWLGDHEDRLLHDDDWLR